MTKTSRNGIGRIAAVVAIVAIVAIAGGVGIVLGSKGSISTSTTSGASSSVSSTTSSSVVSTTNQTSSSNSTVSSSIVPVGCVFSPPGPFVVGNGSTAGFQGSKATYFTGCLTAGATGVYLLGIADPNGVLALGVIRTQGPSQITISGAAVGNLSAAGNGSTAISGNNTTVLSVAQVHLFGSRGYAITVMNESGQNSTVTINVSFKDFFVLEAGG